VSNRCATTVAGAGEAAKRNPRQELQSAPRSWFLAVTVFDNSV
jgi:hypothetical protein